MLQVKEKKRKGDDLKKGMEGRKERKEKERKEKGKGKERKERKDRKKRRKEKEERKEGKKRRKEKEERKERKGRRENINYYSYSCQYAFVINVSGPEKGDAAVTEKENYAGTQEGTVAEKETPKNPILKEGEVADVDVGQAAISNKGTVAMLEDGEVITSDEDFISDGIEDISDTEDTHESQGWILFLLQYHLVCAVLWIGGKRIRIRLWIRIIRNFQLLFFYKKYYTQNNHLFGIY